VRRGTLIVIAGPSGVGKGTVVQGLLARDADGLALSVSATTRAPRAGEVDGVDYSFVSDERFDAMIEAGELLEWAEIVGHRSGTPRHFVDEQRRAGRDVVLEIDVKGAEQVRDQVPDALLIFLLPPSFDELERRLRGRGTEDEQRIEERLRTARWELQQESWFDHRVVNDDLDRATEEVAAIIDGSRTR
jgi:guanylate kinase